MNRFFIRAIALIILGFFSIWYGLQLMDQENNWYKLILSAGVILFGIGFVTLLYYLFREIDLKHLLSQRKKKK